MHTREAEAWYLLEGAITYRAGEQLVHLAPGDFIYLPARRAARLPHDRVDPPSRFLALTLPGALMDLYDEVGVPATERRLPDAGVSPAGRGSLEQSSARSTGCCVVGPPIPPGS